MTWTAPIRRAPQVVTLPPGKLGFTTKQYCDEFIIIDVTSDDGMIMQGYNGTSLGDMLVGMSLISADGKQLKSLEDLPTKCDTSREVEVCKDCISMDASLHSRGQLMYMKDTKCGMFDIMDYSKVEAKYGKEFLDELKR